MTDGKQPLSNLRYDLEDTIQDIKKLDYIICTIYDTGGVMQQSDAQAIQDALHQMRDRLLPYVKI